MTTRVDKTLKELREMPDRDLLNFIINESGYSGGYDGEIGSNFETADGYEIKCWCPLEYILEEIDAYKPKNKNFVAWYDRPERGGYAYKCWAEKNAGIIDEELDIYITHEDEIDITAMLKYIQDCDRVFLPEYEGEDD